MGKHIKKKNFGALKSHDYHVLMQQILPLALHGLFAPRPQMAMTRISKMFRRVCNKVWNPCEIDSLQHDVTVSLTLVEMHFPSSFFTL